MYARGFKVPINPKKINSVQRTDFYLAQSLYAIEERIFSYYELCDIVSKNTSKIFWDESVNEKKLPINCTFKIYV